MELKTDYESLLNDKSYLTQEIALGNLCANFYEDRLSYLNKVDTVDGQIINYSSQPIVYGNYLGINSTNELIFNVSIYPNPSNGFFNIYTDSFDGSTRVTVHSIDGNLIKSYYFNSSSEMSNTKFDLSNLSSGIYFVNIDNKKGTGTKK